MARHRLLVARDPFLAYQRFSMLCNLFFGVDRGHAESNRGIMKYYDPSYYDAAMHPRMSDRWSGSDRNQIERHSVVERTRKYDLAWLGTSLYCHFITTDEHMATPRGRSSR